MSQPNENPAVSTGFSGPVALSGFALSKKYLLETMDNYVKFMSAQLSLFSENVQMYGESISSQASNEQSQMFAAAGQELAGAIGAGITGFMSFSANKQLTSDNAGLSEEDTMLNEHLGNIDDVQKEFETIDADPSSMRAPARRGVSGSSGGGAVDSPEMVIDELETREGTEELSKNGTGSNKLTRYKAAYKKLVEQRNEARARGDTAEAERHKESLNRVRKAMGSTRKELRQKLQICTERMNRNSNMANMKVNSASAYGNAFSSGMRAIGSSIQGVTKSAATYAQSSTQINQAILGTTEKTAGDMASHAQDLIQLERQIQANNVTRG